MITLRRAIVLPIVACVGMLAFVACGDDAETDSSAAQGDVDNISARIERNEILFAVVEVSALPLHDMDESIAAGTIETTFSPAARKALRILTLTDWGTLQADADAIAADATALLAALGDDDVEAAKAPAHKLHDGWHDFSDTVWAQLEKGTPLEQAAEEEHGEETPAPGSTPATGATTGATEAHGE